LGSGHLCHNSRPEIGRFLKKAGVDTGEKTKTGQMKTSADVLAKVDHPAAQDLVKRAKLVKAKTSYIEKLAKSDWTRFNFKIYDTATGRFASGSSDDDNSYYLKFNAQNITKPKACFYAAEKVGDWDDADVNRDASTFLGWKFVPIDSPQDAEYAVEGYAPDRNIRRALRVPADDWYFVSMDFAQEELMLAAMLSREPVLMEAFRHYEDSHRAVALEMFGKENYNRDARKKGKIANFALLFGGNKWTLAASSGLPVDECEEIYERYWKSLKVLRTWKKKRVAEAFNSGGTAYTIYQRPRRLKHWLTHSSPQKRSYGERSVVSHIIQGSSGDIMRICLVRFFKEIWANFGRNENVRFVNAVHDEVDFVVRQNCFDDVYAATKKAMELTPPGCELALRTSLEVGNSYGYMFEFEKIEGEYRPVRA